MTYNLENLFDTINEPTLQQNDEFTPQGSNKWGTMKYNAKLKNNFLLLRNICYSSLNLIRLS